jgi:hypothetical protein
VSANLTPGFEKIVLFEIIGEDGRPIFREYREVFFPPGNLRFDIFEDLYFTIPGEAETAHIRLTTADEYDRITAIASVEVILFNEGRTSYNIAGDLKENIVIQYPYPDTTTKGETLVVSGIARTQSQLPLEVTLIDRDGQVLGTASASLLQSPESEYTPFTAIVPFSVREPTWALLAVSENGDRIPGTVHLSSLELVLSP